MGVFRPSTWSRYYLRRRFPLGTSGTVDGLLADDVESASEVSSPSLGQVHVLLADDTQSTSEVSSPAVGQEHALLADDTQSTSEVSAPVLGESNVLLADDVESASEVTAPTIGQVHALTSASIESASDVSGPSLGQEHVLLADDTESASEVTSPSLVSGAIAVVSGTLDGSTETQLLTPGRTVVWTLTNDTWVAAGTGPIGSTAVSQAVIDGIVSAQSEPQGWNAVRSSINVIDLVRTSDTVATLTLPALAYDITANETLTVTIPATALTGATEIVATPTIGIVADVEDEEQNSGGWAAQNWYDGYRQQKQRRKKKRKKILEEIKELEGTEREIARILQKDLERDERDREIAELEQMVKSTYTKGQVAQARLYNERVARAYVRAATESSFAALEIFEREMERAKDEEELLFLAMLL